MPCKEIFMKHLGDHLSGNFQCISQFKNFILSNLKVILLHLYIIFMFIDMQKRKGHNKKYMMAWI